MSPTAEEEAKRKAEEEEAKRKAEAEQEESHEEEPELTLEELKAQLAENKKHIKALNKESAERRIKLEAYEKAEAERKQADLSEVEKANAKAKQEESEKLRLSQENKTLKLQGAFTSKVRAMKLEFANENAERDAFQALDLEVVGEDISGMDAAIKKLVKERAYYFGTGEQTQTIEDGAAKGKINAAALTTEAINKKKRSVSPL